MNAPRFVALLLLAATLGACGGKDTTRKPYYGDSLVPPLEVPPDLTKPEDQGNAPIEGAANYSDLDKNKTDAGAAVLPQYDGMKIMGTGDTYWLFVKQPPEKVWNAVHDFVLSQGLPIAAEDARLGIIDTEWVESRLDTGDFLQKYVGKIAPKLFSSGMRDRYRVRLERVAGGTEVHIAHRGMEEVTLNEGTGIQIAQTKWQRRPSDPELEIELLARLQEQLGGAAVARPGANRGERAQLTRDKQALWIVRMRETMDSAWQRVGAAVDRLGYVVKGRDAANRIYNIRYAVPSSSDDDKRFWQKAIGDIDAPAETIDYRLALKTDGDGIALQLQNKKGEPVPANTAEPIMVQLYQQLK